MPGPTACVSGSPNLHILPVMPVPAQPEMSRSFTRSSFRSTSTDSRAVIQTSEAEDGSESVRCSYSRCYCRPSSDSFQACEVSYDDSSEFVGDSYSRQSVQTTISTGDRPSTAHARLQRPWLPPRIETLPTTSEEFAELFPSSRELRIQHDDSTMDGNMNLKVDTSTTSYSGMARNVILFHLRMYYLKSRDFSLRRYCRESGREMCHSIRKSPKRGAKPTVQRSIGQAFAIIKSKADALHLHHHHHHDASQNDAVKEQVELHRQDSGYDSAWDEDDNARPESAKSASSSIDTNYIDSISLEFSNYAHVDLRRRGLKGHKRYDFGYWGEAYSWNVMAQRVGHVTEASYTLLRRRDGHVMARIFPQPLSEAEARAEADKGGWIPPCWMRITDETVLAERHADLADVIVMTGLCSLADDCIRRHFHRPAGAGVKQLVLPLTKLQAQRHKRAATVGASKAAAD